MIPINYIEKTYAGWLGKIIGIRLGSPIEGWTYELIEKTYGEITDYLVDYKDYSADDDSNGPGFFVRALVDYSHKIDEITEKEMGYTWLNYIPERHGFLWWGGYGISTEHTAYYNLKSGIDAPRSGSIEQNGAPCAEQIGGQIFSDCWGFVAPGKPLLAAEYAKKMSGVSHDGDGIYGGMFVAACIAAAYTNDNITDVINEGLAVIPEISTYYKVCNDVIDYYNNDKEKCWRGCFQFVKANYGYDKYPGNCHIIPNTAVMILSMLYGDGDYSKTQCICNMCGWDTDCNAGNIGAIVGVLVGIDGIEDKWITPINDLLLSSSTIGSLNITTVAKSMELFCSLGYKIAGEEPPTLWRERFESNDYILHFDLSKSTQAMRVDAKSSIEASVRNSNEQSGIGERALKIIANRVFVGDTVKIYHKTYYRPDDLHDSRYDPGFTPILFPNQTVHTSLLNDTDATVYAKIYVYDVNNDVEYESEAVEIGSGWTDIEYKIPEMDGGLIKRVGINLYTDEPLVSPLIVYMDYLRFSGAPKYNIDFNKERIENYGPSAATLHLEVSQFTYRNGMWDLEEGYLSASCHDEGEAYTGLYHMRDYEYQCTLYPQIGEHHLINFRVQGGARCYAFGFNGKGKVALLKKDVSYSVLKETEYDWELLKEYVLKVKVCDNSFTAYIDGEEIFAYTDEYNAYSYGQMGVTVLNGSHCHYKDIVIK